MRLDRFLKQAGVIKRRTMAKNMEEAGKILKDGTPLKPAYQVKPGDIIDVVFYSRTVRIKVTDDKSVEVINVIKNIDKSERRGHS